MTWRCTRLLSVVWEFGCLRCGEPPAISLLLATHAHTHIHTDFIPLLSWPSPAHWLKRERWETSWIFYEAREPHLCLPHPASHGCCVQQRAHTPAENRNNVLNAIIVRPKQCHLSREHLGLYNKFHIINTIFHPLSSLSDLWHACDLRWSLNYNSSNKRENGPGLLLLPTGAQPPPLYPRYTHTHTQS